MKFVSFNINGLRARPHQLAAIIEQHQPDVIGLQETKVHDDMFPLEEVSQHGYHVFYHGQKGHYGVALLTKDEPLAVRRGFPTDEEDAQRRIIMADLATPQGTLTVINGYFPQGESRDHPIKFPAKTRFYQDLQNYLQQLPAESQVLIMGDMNISPSDLDIGIGEESRKRWLRTGKCSFLPEEREWMGRLLDWGLVDTYRHANPERNDEFSWFDYRSRGFDENRGLRIDLLLANTSLAARCTATGIDYQIRAMEKPSDHAPVWAEFRTVISLPRCTSGQYRIQAMKIIDVVAAIIEQDGKILLAQRDSSSDQAGLWEFPGGKVEMAESQPQALARELKEELGIIAKVGSFVASNQWQQSERIIRLHAWQVNSFSGELQLHCHSAFAWVTPEQARDYPLAPADIPLLESYIRLLSPSPQPSPTGLRNPH